MGKREYVIDLNADLGEGYGPYAYGEDEALLRIVTSANVACGFHAGDPHTMRRTVERCVELGVSVGAHPGLADRLGFGRREMRLSPDEIYDWVLYQAGALQAFVTSAGGRMRHIKPHGALYHMAAKDAAAADAVVRAARSLDRELIVFGPPNSRMQEAAERQGVGFAAEGFADRTYMPDGKLAARELEGSLIGTPERAAAQAVALAKYGKVRTPEGGWIDMPVHTICLHSDTPGAAEMAKRIADALREADVRIRAIGG